MILYVPFKAVGTIRMALPGFFEVPIYEQFEAKTGKWFFVLPASASSEVVKELFRRIDSVV